MRRIIYFWLLSCFLSFDLFSLDFKECAKFFLAEEGLNVEQILALGNAKTDGSFDPMSPEKRRIFEKAFLEQRASGFQKSIIEGTRRLEEADLVHTIDMSTPKIMKHISDLRTLKASNSTNNLSSLPIQISAVLQRYGYNLGFGKTYLFTSAGGAWSRGGNIIKAFVPLNISDFITPKERSILVFADGVFKSGKDTEVLKALLENKDNSDVPSEFVLSLCVGNSDCERMLKDIKKVLDSIKAKDKDASKNLTYKEILMKIQIETGITPEDIRKLVKNVKAQLVTRTRPIIEKYQFRPKAINIIDLKILTAAIISALTHSYYVLDFWTGEHNHEYIKKYIEDFKNTYMTRTFSSDEQINAGIRMALYNYLQASEQLHETFLFGYMELIPPINYTDSTEDEVLWIEDAISNAPGVSSIVEYLQSTARIQQLERRGIDSLLFNNLEVLGFIHREIVAYRNVTSKDPSVDGTFIFVPKSPGDTGGFARVDARGRKLLLEQSQVPEKDRNDFLFFNTNTLIMRFGANPSTEIGFETKEYGTQARVKMNLGDLSHFNNTEIILGSKEQNYTNFKTFTHYLKDGKDFISGIEEWVCIMVLLMLVEGSSI